jgi:phosphoserine phosphatase RsbU/P
MLGMHFMKDLSFSHLQAHGQHPVVNKEFERELYLARNIQMKLLNGKVPTLKDGEVAGFSIPAHLIGGDYYDFYVLKDGRLRIVIGDVMGKGIPAAMLMILTRGAFRSAAESTDSPGKTLTAINHALYEDLRTLRSFVTLFCADWDPKTNMLTYASAGHLLPLFIKGNEKVIKEIPEVKGTMIGGLPNQVYKEETIYVEKNDIIFFYTDGVLEAQDKDGNQYKIDRLVHTLFSHMDKGIQEIGRFVIESVNAFTNGVPQKDDITMVMLKIGR